MAKQSRFRLVGTLQQQSGRMGNRTSLVILWALLAVAAVPCVLAGEKTHRYEENEPVILWVNKVGPFNNPQQTYNYFYLPFCKHQPDKKDEHSWGGLGEVLQGNELINSQLDIRFKRAVPSTTICKQKLTQEQAAQFADAIRRHYWYELFMDDLPIWGFVGRVTALEKDEVVQMYTHKHLNISYNKDQIIHVNLTSEELVPVEPGAEFEFTFSVDWHSTALPFSERFGRYLDFGFFEHKIHWFSVINSFMMVLFLTGLVGIILMRTLRRDYARYASAEGDLESLERDLNEETGWKLVHGDVFRPPAQRMLLAACVGTGMQLCLLAVATIGVTIAGTMYEDRGAILTVFIVCYALTSFVGGYFSGSTYTRMEGKKWVRCMLLTACLLPGAVFTIAAVLNTIAIAYGSLAAVPFGYILIVLLLWAFLSFPLCILGSIIGRNWAAGHTNPCRVKRIPSPIPAKPWYLTPPAIAVAGGLLPFGSIFIEMYFVFTSFWNYKVYYVYGFMLLVLLIMLVVTCCVTVVGTYFLLNAENYHWPWTSFAMSATSAAYVFLYSVHYFLFKTHMSGFFQTCFYFGYTTIFCLGLGVMAGALGYIASAAFVRRIYSSVKCD